MGRGGVGVGEGLAILKSLLIPKLISKTNSLGQTDENKEAVLRILQEKRFKFRLIFMYRGSGPGFQVYVQGQVHISDKIKFLAQVLIEAGALISGLDLGLGSTS